MKTLTSIALLTILYSFPLLAQDNHEKAIRTAFEEYKKAVLSVDLPAQIKFAHPNIVAIGGGEAYYIDELTNDYNMYSSSGMKLKDVEVNQPSKVLSEEKSLQAMLPYVKSFEIKSKLVTEEHFFLATSLDGGKTWYFTDLKKYDPKSIKTFIPNYNSRLNIYLNSINH